MKKTSRVALTLTAVLLCFVFIALSWPGSCYFATSNHSTSKPGRYKKDVKKNVEASKTFFYVESVNSDLQNQKEKSGGATFTSSRQRTRHKFHRHSTSVKAMAAINVTDWRNTVIRTLTVSQIIDYLLWTNQSSCQIVQYFGGLMVSSSSGVVSMDGQKAICLDSNVVPRPYRCLVYSFGINNEWSFDDAMELYGCKVFSFDPSMNVSNHDRSENIHFFQMALNDVDRNQWNKNLAIPSRSLFSIYSMLEPMHGANVIIDFLKIDIEATEWRVLPQILESGMMDKVRQLSVEIHMDFKNAIKICCQHANIIQSLENYGMIRFDSKPNVYSGISVYQRKSLGYEAYEIAWYNSKILHHYA